MTDLIKYARNIVRSQFGQDGVLAEVFKRIGEGSKWCVELGAYDGMYASNTRALIEKGWKSVQIEQDRDRFVKLADLYIDNPDVTCINETVYGNLDALLARSPIPDKFDLLVIDVDNDDYHIWKALETYRPRVVCIETNPTFGPEVEYVPKVGLHIGSSLAAMVKLAESRHYRLAAYIGIDAIFVDAMEYLKLAIKPCTVAEHFAPSMGYVPILASDLDGTHFLVRPGPWNGRSDDEVLIDRLKSRNDLRSTAEVFVGGERV